MLGRHVVGWIALGTVATGVALALPACGDSSGSGSAFGAGAGTGWGAGTGSGGTGAGNGSGGTGAGLGLDASGGDGTVCDNLCLQQVSCPTAGTTTTLSGTVLAPTPAKFGAADPLYNAIVYVPNRQVQPFATGVSCDQCGQVSGSPLVSAITGPDGKFTLEDVPVGTDIPLVIQLGRWRRQVVIPTVAECVDTQVPADLTRLPRNAGEGDIPLHAISTGSADALECVLRKIGIDDTEFTAPAGGGRVRLYEENGATIAGTQPASALYNDPAKLAEHDIVILDCEGGQHDKPASAQKNVIDYTSNGGRVFASHYSYVWLYNDAPFSGTASWNVGQTHPSDPLAGFVDTTFPKGQAFAAWLGIVGALSAAPDQIAIHVPRHDADAVVAPSQRCIYSKSPASLQHYTFNTPVGVAEDKQCGRVVFSDFHVTGTAGSSGGQTFPANCDNGPLTPQEKVLEFMMFDLASCIQPDSKPPTPPIH
jgi:hypothetical protein